MELSSRTNQATRSVPGRHTRCTFIVYILFVLEMVYLFHSTQNNQRVFLYVVYVVGGHVFRSRLPLCHDLPALLPTGELTTPTIGVLFGILIRQKRFKSTTMQIQLHHVRSGEPLLRQAGKEEFIDNPFPRDANRTLLVPGGMGCDNNAAMDTFWSYGHIRAIVETTHDQTFWAVLQLVGGEVQTGLNERMIEDGVIFATHHKGKICQVCNDRPSAILSIDAQHSLRLPEVVCSQVAINGRERLAQFHSVVSIAWGAKRAEQVRTVSLTDNRPRPHDFSSLASGVARSTEVIQSSKGRWEFLCLRECPLACGLTRPVDVEDDSSDPYPVHQITDVVFLRERTTEQVIER